MLAPKKVKHRKVHRGSMAGQAKGNTEIHFGEFALKAMDRCWLTANQIEAARIAMTRHVKRGGKIWIRVFPDKSYTKKPAETRMGSGKGAPEGWVAVIKPGRVLFEMGGVTPEVAKRAFQLAAYKLPIKTRTVGIKSGVKAAVDIKIKGPAEPKPGEASLPGAPAAVPAAAAAPAAAVRAPKAAPGAAPAASKGAAAPAAKPAAPAAKPARGGGR